MKVFFSIIFTFAFSLFMLTFGGMFIDYWTDDEHSVLVEYTIYTHTLQLKKSEVFRMSGDSFTYRIMSSKGSNYVDIIKRDYWFAPCCNQAVCLYAGNCHVDVTNIKIIE